VRMTTIFDVWRLEGAITPTQPSPIMGEGFEGRGGPLPHHGGAHIGTLPLDGGGQGGGDAPDRSDMSIVWTPCRR
jgi:hypothetical protein